VKATTPALDSSIERLAAELANLSDGEWARLQELRIAAGTQDDTAVQAADADTASGSSPCGGTGGATSDQALQESPQSDAWQDAATAKGKA
jgi:hypothetical protein